MPLVKTYHSTGPAGSHTVEEFETRAAGEVRAQVGDVFLIAGRLRLVKSSCESRCTHVALLGQTKNVTVEDRKTGEERTFAATSYGSEDSCCQRLPAESLVKRLGETAYADFQTAKTDGTVAAWLNQQLGAEIERHNEMKTATKTNAKPKTQARGGLAADAAALAKQNATAAPTPRKKREPKAPATPKPAGMHEEAKGRAARVGELVAAGTKDADIIKEIAATFPGSSESLVKRIIARKRK